MALDLAKLGFGHAERGGRAAALRSGRSVEALSLRYINQVRSSRRLAREAERNLELIWLMKGLRPGYRTIAKFRKDNWAALKSASRDFVLLARQLALLGGELVAVDGAFFDGNASKASIVTHKRLAEELRRWTATLRRTVARWRRTMRPRRRVGHRATMAAMAMGAEGAKDSGTDGQAGPARADLERLEAGGETQLSRTDADARLLSKSGQTVAGYNVQIAVDESTS